ncbi:MULTISPECIES: restriction endonuclease subunit S [Idiomarina]|uniref:restriction endonuclease subunit S n=1 Tax=Idiomarina TaxID=135575 RepID=UPI00129CDE7E|nr:MULTISPECIES: restriction endonuclease subunit S [Idiomarina]MRJ42231.1 restriction endonuclease subunit S [Idiomarina sp. FeN1]NCU57355.1 restriction endonuclease subunit S [Idiomarina sp. FenA--70]NCU60542.1 restriction endonuclease subunit S [Idiomarina sp. FenBw--71]UUN14723.1 restriction endonuclease subunit S [Idiomarina loihiensis]
MDEKQALVPRLRFPEFRDTGGWDNCNLGDISTVVRGGSPRPIDGFITKDNSGLNWLKIGDVNKDDKYVTKTQEKVRVEALSKTREVHPDDLILSNSMSFGRPYLMKIKSCIHDGWIAITEIEESVEREYLYYLIFSPASQSYFLDNAAGSGVLNLNAEIIKSLPIAFPAQTEQQKIADCLSSLDALIAAQADKIDALKDHKKGLMQQLFPREGETVPRLRFPEFRDAGEWEKKQLIDTTDKKIKWSFIGGPFGSNLKSSDFVPEGIRVIQLQNIGDGEFFNDYKIFTSKEKADELLSNNIYSGEIILSKMGDPVGRACLIPDIHDRYVMCSDGIRLVVDENSNHKYFVYLVINSPNFRSKVEKAATGSTRKRIGLDDLKKLPILLPAKKEEQQKIADCLSSLGALIATHTEKLDALKTHKKGLMQKLFPSREAVGV